MTLDSWYGDGWTRASSRAGDEPARRQPEPADAPDAGQTDKGPDFSVNGRLQPVIDMKPGEVQIWRIVNASGRSGAFFVGPPPGFDWRQIAQDGVQFADAELSGEPNKPSSMASGNRVDLLVQAPTTPAIYPVIVQHEVDPSDLKSAYPVTLVSVRIKATDQPVSGNQSQFIPTAPKPSRLPRRHHRRRGAGHDARSTSRRSGPGAPLRPAHHQRQEVRRPGERREVLLNTVEEWKIMNATANPQHLASVPHPHEPVPGRGGVRPE